MGRIFFALIAMAPLSPWFAMGQSKFSQDPNVSFASTPLQWERQYSLERTAIIHYPIQGDSVYAEAAHEAIQGFLETDGRWDVYDPSKVEESLKRDIIQVDAPNYTAEQLRAWSEEWDVDTLWVVSIKKKGASAELDLKLWNRSTRENWLRWNDFYETGKDLEPTKKVTLKTLRTLLGQIPFDGKVLSRTDKTVTINLGSKSGIKTGQSLIITRISALKRDPGKQALSEMFLDEIGRITVTKVDDGLSFAEISKESPENPILTHHKVVIPVEPTQAPSVADKQKQQNAMEKVAFGDNAESWTPRRKPSLGMIGLSLGLGTMKVADTPTGSTYDSSRSNFIPSVRLDGELWLTQGFFLNSYLQQALVGVSDSSGSNPVSLSSGTTSLGLFPGYRYLIQQSVMGPQIRFMMGYNRFSHYLDSSSSATQKTSKTYHGFTVASDLIIPIKTKYFVGLGFNRTFFTFMDEAPVTSGADASNVAWSFWLNGGIKMAERWQWVAAIRFESYSSTFAGQGTRSTPSDSSSITPINFQSGVSYFF